MTKLQKKLFFLSLFTLIGFLSLQIPFNKLWGSNVSFTLFDFFGPIAGAFLGPVLGVGSVLVVEVVNMLIRHNPWTMGSLIRLFPTLFAVLYFASSKKSSGRWILAVPLISILVFVANPIGRQVFYYALMFWLIPVIAYFKKDNLFIKSLGATMTAHAVGGAAWIWLFHLPAAAWNSLIPVVITERLLFTCGIAVSYYLIKHSLNFLASKKLLPKPDFAVS